MNNLIDAMRVKVTEGRVLFLLCLALCVGANWSLFKWNAGFSVALVLGFIVVAQECISAYFESGSDDPLQVKIVLLMTAGYCALFGMCLWKWNDLVGGELIVGFLTFARKLQKEYFRLNIAPAVTPPAVQTPVAK